MPRAAHHDRSATQHGEGDGVERPGLDPLPHPRRAQPAAQLSGGLSGEREGQGVTRLGGPGGDAVGDAPGEHPRLARACRGDDGDECRRRRHGRPLFHVEIAK
jgi:hypothetical protein